MYLDSITLFAILFKQKKNSLENALMTVLMGVLFNKQLVIIYCLARHMCNDITSLEDILSEEYFPFIFVHDVPYVDFRLYI